MAFAGNCGIEVDIKHNEQSSSKQKISSGVTLHLSLSLLFSEELGLIFEYLPESEDRIKAILGDNNISCQIIGKTVKEKEINMRINNETILKEGLLNQPMLDGDNSCLGTIRNVQFGKDGTHVVADRTFR